VSAEGKTSDDNRPSFWASLRGVLTVLAGLVSAVTGLLVSLNLIGVLGDEENDEQPNSVVESTSPTPSSTPSSTDSQTPSQAPTESASSAAAGVGDALAGSWRGIAAGPDGADQFEVVLEIVAPCHVRKPCGSISVSSAPCTGRVRLWNVQSQTYELYVDRFTANSSPDCTPGAGDFVELQGDGTLRYFTSYSDAVGTLERAQ
jgi:hypothetical protein